jgi:hypothetical protein
MPDPRMHAWAMERRGRESRRRNDDRDVRIQDVSQAAAMPHKKHWRSSFMDSKI